MCKTEPQECQGLEWLSHRFCGSGCCLGHPEGGDSEKNNASNSNSSARRFRVSGYNLQSPSNPPLSPPPPLSSRVDNSIKHFLSIQTESQIELVRGAGYLETQNNWMQGMELNTICTCRSGKLAVTRFFFVPLYQVPGTCTVPAYVRRVGNPNHIIRGISGKDGVAKTLAPSEKNKKKQLWPTCTNSSRAFLCFKYICTWKWNGRKIRYRYPTVTCGGNIKLNGHIFSAGHWKIVYISLFKYEFGLKLGWQNTKPVRGRKKIDRSGSAAITMNGWYGTN